MEGTMDKIQNELAVLAEKALKYEEKMRKNNECAKKAYYKRMAREQGVSLEYWLEHRPKRGGYRGKKQVETSS